MEALASSVFIPKFPETIPVSTSSSSIRKLNKGSGSLKISEGSQFAGLRPLALARDLPNPSEGEGEGEGEEEIILNNRFGLVSEEAVAKGNLNHCQSSEKDTYEQLKIDLSLTAPSGNGAGGGTRAGLFRTPISGGVQSATTVHGLPRPSLAVRNLMEQARFAHLCTVMSRMHHRREGYPFGSLVDFAPDSIGHPIFSFSPLAIHARNLLANPRCTLVVQEWAHKQYIAKHQHGPSQQWGNFYYFRMQNISDIYFIGGFGTVAWVDVKEYETLQPDKIAVDGGEQNLKELNAIFSKPLKELLSTESEVDDAALISIDSKGTDIRVRQGAQFNIQRIPFDEVHVETLEEAKAALQELINKGRVYNLQK
ncbi:Pyridoxamine 5'-phosphate oxidase-related, FMN-binding [Quillaja saponaria]|uniref:Pyridoxamine 5'-phosphate oxidase-related, FMN-binding n=1 Tax=Quillaja saponaria TaxID=32244 RepID=A0AAD7LQV2_QUISA|nr:Pyridoxamine 5'-phosphate oxidase-related, FMN-binding [Quillaja saponaria]